MHSVPATPSPSQRPAAARVRRPGVVRPGAVRPGESVFCCPALLLAAALAVGGGFDWKEKLPVDYAAQNGRSVNGVDVFVGLCRDQGARVRTAPRWSAVGMEKASVVVWFDEDGAPPAKDERKVVENWLRARAGRVAVYVARDYDAEVDYWNLLAKVDPAKAAEYQDWARYARLKVDLRAALGAQDDGDDWIAADPGRAGARGGTLRGEPEWVEAASGGEHEIDLPRAWRPGALSDVLLAAGDRAVVLRQEVECDFGGRSALYVVANGSFLFNLPLRLEAHRGLAKKLVEALHADAARARADHDADSEANDHSVAKDHSAAKSDAPPLWLFLTAEKVAQNDGPPASAWNFLVGNPVGALLQQASGLGLLALVAAWPILGRARRLVDVHLKDFGRHVEALGRLLARTRDEAYARRRIREYDQHGRGKGASPQAQL